jgi:hypothetical protein
MILTSLSQAVFSMLDVKVHKRFCGLSSTSQPQGATQEFESGGVGRWQGGVTVAGSRGEPRGWGVDPKLGWLHPRRGLYKPRPCLYTGMYIANSRAIVTIVRIYSTM